MPDMARENIGGRSQSAEAQTDGPTIQEWVAAGYRASNYPPAGYTSKSTPEEIAAAVDAEVAGKAPPKVAGWLNPDMPDIASPNDVAMLRPGTRFLARFIVDPLGDTGRQAKENIKDLMAGRMIRHGLSRDYWANHYDRRPPIAVAGRNGKYTLTE